MGRRGTMTRWLLAAGCIALVGCRTELGEEESSSWFNFSSRRHGGGHGGADRDNTPSAPTKTPPDRVSEAWNEPATPARAAKPKPAGSPTTPDRLDQPKVAPTGTGKPLPLPTGHDAAGAREGRTLPLPSLGEGSPPDPRRSPRLTVKLPEADGPQGHPVASPLLDLDGSGRTSTSKGRPTLNVPDAPTGATAPRQPITLPTPSAGATTRPPGDQLKLPDLAAATSLRHSAATLRLPDLTETPASRPTLPGGLGSDLPTTAAGSSLTGARPGWPDLLAGGTRPAPAGAVPIDWDGLLTELDPATGRAKALPSVEPTGGGAPGRASASGFRAMIDGADPLASAVPAATIPGLRPATSAQATSTGTSPLVDVGPGPTTDGREAAASPRLDATMTAPDARIPAVARALPPLPPARPAETRIPLPFRLSEWISDEQQHRLWRQQHLERAEQAPTERQAEQDRLREALLKWLIRDPAAR